MLSGGHLVVTGLHLQPNFLQVQADLPAGALSVVQRTQVKVTGGISGLHSGAALLVCVKQEELQLRSHIEGESQILSFTESLFQNTPGISGKGGPVRVMHIADQPGYPAILGPPGKQRKGVQVRPEILV